MLSSHVIIYVSLVVVWGYTGEPYWQDTDSLYWYTEVSFLHGFDYSQARDFPNDIFLARYNLAVY